MTANVLRSEQPVQMSLFVIRAFVSLREHVGVRNLVRKATSFRLQTSSDWFYPDFLCRLTDRRVLAVEYKGRDRFTAEDAEEKRAGGAVWASRSNGRCVFVTPTGADFSSIERAIRK